jgi:hypothetical protein
MNGTNGTNGFGTLQMVRHQCTDNLNGTQTSCTVSCPPGLFGSGGGVAGEGAFADHQQVNGTRPNPNDAAPTGWTGFVNNEAGGTNTTITMYVVCVNANDTGFSVNPDGSAQGGK